MASSSSFTSFCLILCKQLALPVDQSYRSTLIGSTRRPIVAKYFDWSDRWTIDAIRAYAKPLQNPIVEAFGTVVWRKSGGIVRESFTIPLKVEQQAEYYAAIKDVTHDFTIRPDTAPITITRPTMINTRTVLECE